MKWKGDEEVSVSVTDIVRLWMPGTGSHGDQFRVQALPTLEGMDGRLTICRLASQQQGRVSKASPLQLRFHAAASTF